MMTQHRTREAFRVMLLALIALNVCVRATGQVPGIIAYQGRITAGGTNFEGEGNFKFALLQHTSGESLWSNDGTSVNGSEPIRFIALPVDGGLFDVPLGDTTYSNMIVIPFGIFTNEDVRLRLWFREGTNAFVQLSPDQRIVSVGYAMMGANVPDGSITTAKLADGAVTGDQVAPNSIGSADIADTLTLERLNLGGVNWDGNLYLYAKPAGGGGIIDPNGAIRGYLFGDEFGSEFTLLQGNGRTGAVVAARAPGGRLRLWDGLGTPTAILGTTLGGGDLNLYQISGDLGIRLDGDRSTYDNQASSGGEISVFNRDGEVGLLLDGDHDGAGRIEVRQRNLIPYVDIFGRGAGNGGEIRVKDSAGNTTTVEILGAEDTATGGQITLRQANNTATILIDGEFNPSGGGRIELRDGDGTSTIGMQASGTDATLTGGGILRLGPTGGANLVLDGNEITARNNAIQAPLFLNPNQGNVVIGRTSELTPPARLLVESDDGQPSLRVRVGTSTRFYVSGTGQVGINTTNLPPGYELSVNGQIICEELVVQDSADWPDYVFGDDYPLMPLEELEQRVQRDRHLPGIPTAEQVRENGVSVSDIQKRMLEKIEELTLYVLQQNRRLQAQEEELKSLRTQITGPQ